MDLRIPGLWSVGLLTLVPGRGLAPRVLRLRWAVREMHVGFAAYSKAVYARAWRLPLPKKKASRGGRPWNHRAVRRVRSVDRQAFA